MVTIQDVAKMAGVSVATVSRVLNNHSSVASKTKQKVEEAMNKLHYQPNLLGRNLRRSETKMILVLLQNISNPFYSKVVKGIEDVGHKSGYNIMVCNTDSDRSREKQYLDLLINRLVDGAIFMAPEIEGKELTEISNYYPVIQCCEYKQDAAVSRVSIDDASAAYGAVKHLIGLGHKRIGMISGKNHLPSALEREEGYKKALKESDIPFEPELIKYESYGFKGGLRAAKQFLNMDQHPTAIFAISDIMAIGAIREIKLAGLKVPEDIAIVGFDDTSIASMYDPLLTTIAQPRYDLGCVTMELLLKRIKGELTEPQIIRLEHELIIRESTVKY